VLIAIVVAGSLWVMHNANENMMPMQMSPEQARAHEYAMMKAKPFSVDQIIAFQSEQVRVLKHLRAENARLKKLVNELSLDKAILQDVARLYSRNRLSS
jgi:hypothetical protein